MSRAKMGRNKNHKYEMQDLKVSVQNTVDNSTMPMTPHALINDGSTPTPMLNIRSQLDFTDKGSLSSRPISRLNHPEVFSPSTTTRALPPTVESEKPTKKNRIVEQYEKLKFPAKNTLTQNKENTKAKKKVKPAKKPNLLEPHQVPLYSDIDQR